jgi:serine O-acetyltransferase
LWSICARDLAHYAQVQGATSGIHRWLLPVTAPSLLALWTHRLGRAAQRARRPWPRLPLKVGYAVAHQFISRWTKISLPVGAVVGEGVWMSPVGHIIVAPGSELGDGLRLMGGNTIGIGGRPGARGVPRLGARVTLGPGASVVGPVSLADDVTIAANSVVTRSCETAGVFMGLPAKETSLPALPRSYGASMLSSKSVEEPAPPFWAHLKQDLGRHLVYHRGVSTLTKVKLLATIDGAWAMAVYRLGRSWGRRRGVIGGVLGALCSVAEWGVRMVSGIHLHREADIAPGFYIGHFGGICVGPGVRIGRDSSISQMCFVASHDGSGRGAPTLGERVYLGAGCKVLGEVRVGSDAAIGANAVVMEDIPAQGVATGIPAQVVSMKGSRDFIYLGEGAQPERPATIDSAPAAH